ncbi:hypothetical protein [Mycobacterium sp. URHB0021]
MAAAILGVGGPALAVAPGNAPLVLQSVANGKNGIDHLEWLDNIRPKAKVPMVNTSVHQSR